MSYADLTKRREYHRLYMQEHKKVLTPEQKIKKAKAYKIWSQKNTEKLQAYQHNRYQRDREMMIEQRKKHRRENPEAVKTSKKKYYQENRETVLKAVKEYRDKNPYSTYFSL